MARHTTLLSALAVLATCGVGCGAGLGDDDSSTTNPITGAGSSSTSSGQPFPWTTTFDSTTKNSDSPTGSDSSSGAGTTEGVFSSTGTIPDFGGALGCAGKIDLLFVLSRSDTMVNEYPTVAASLPLFLETIQSAWEDFDVHIMTAPTNKLVPWGMPPCDEQCPLNGGDGCEPFGPADYPCWGYDNLDSCDVTFGAGVTFPAAFEASNKRCELYGGNRYIVGDDPDLEASFDCITRVGYSTIAGTLAATGMLAALSPELLAPGACNEGFLRDDAILVIVIITDVYNGGDSPVEPEAWASAILDLKNGDQSSIAVVLLNPDGYDVDDPVCDGPGKVDWVKTPLVEFLDHFDNGIRGSICEPSFAPFFQSAAEFVVETCELYTPQ